MFSRTWNDTLNHSSALIQQPVKPPLPASSWLLDFNCFDILIKFLWAASSQTLSLFWYCHQIFEGTLLFLFSWLAQHWRVMQSTLCSPRQPCLVLLSVWMCQTYFSFSAPGSVSHSAQKVISVYFLARFKSHLFVPWEIYLGTSLEHSLSCLKW